MKEVGSLKLLFEKFSAPNKLWIFPKLSRDDTHAYARQVKKVLRKGVRFVTNVEGAQVRQVVAERHKGLDGYVENIINDYILGLQTPLPKLFTTPGFTEAFARAAQCRLSQKQPTVREIELSDMLKVFELGAVRRDELRKNLAKSGWEMWQEWPI